MKSRRCILFASAQAHADVGVRRQRSNQEVTTSEMGFYGHFEWQQSCDACQTEHKPTPASTLFAAVMGMLWWAGARAAGKKRDDAPFRLRASLM